MILCNARCRHRSGEGCALDQAGKPVLLGATGQCELKEDPTQTTILPTISACSHPECEQDATDFCRICGIAICAEHRYEHAGQMICLTHFLMYGPDLTAQLEDDDDHRPYGATGDDGSPPLGSLG